MKPTRASADISEAKMDISAFDTQQQNNAWPPGLRLFIHKTYLKKHYSTVEQHLCGGEKEKELCCLILGAKYYLNKNK